MKTKLIAATYRFNFLDWNFTILSYGKFKNEPSNENYLTKTRNNEACYTFNDGIPREKK